MEYKSYKGRKRYKLTIFEEIVVYFLKLFVIGGFMFVIYCLVGGYIA